LSSRLQRLATMQLATWQILETYTARPVPPRPSQPFAALTTLQVCKLMNGGTSDERRSVIASLETDARRRFLATSPARALEGLPDLQQEAAAARQAEQQERQMEFRRLMPPLNELLAPEQMRGWVLMPRSARCSIPFPPRSVGRSCAPSGLRPSPAFPSCGAKPWRQVSLRSS
jgi:hypothetical protein